MNRHTVVVFPIGSWAGASPSALASAMLDADAHGGMDARNAVLARALRDVRARLDRVGLPPALRREAIGRWTAAVLGAEDQMRRELRAAR